MTYVISAAAGLVWGAAVAYVNYLITCAAVKKNSTNLLLLTNVSKMFLDILALGIVYLLRNVLPIDYTVCLIATAAGLSILTIVFSLKAAKSSRTE